jgi:hypothetical protein
MEVIYDWSPSTSRPTWMFLSGEKPYDFALFSKKLKRRNFVAEKWYRKNLTSRGILGGCTKASPAHLSAAYDLSATLAHIFRIFRIFREETTLNHPLGT